MPRAKVNGTIVVSVDVRETMNGYICDKVGTRDGQYSSSTFAMHDLADMLVSLGKDRGIKLKVVFERSPE